MDYVSSLDCSIHSILQISQFGGFDYIDYTFVIEGFSVLRQ